MKLCPQEASAETDAILNESIFLYVGPLRRFIYNSEYEITYSRTKGFILLFYASDE